MISISKSSKLLKECSIRDVLEHDIESLMVKLDNEKRESEYLDEVIKTQEADFRLLKLTKSPSSPRKNPLISKIYLLERQIEYETAQFDSLKSENFEIRKEINELRLENMACKKSLKGLQLKISSSSTKAFRVNELNKAGLAAMTSNESKISAIRSKSVLSANDYRLKVREMSVILNQKSDVSLTSKKKLRLEQLLNNLKGCNVYKVLTDLQPR